MTEQTERERVIATCDRIAQRMGGRFVEREDNQMTDTPEAVAWLYTCADDPTHREAKTQRYAPAYVARVGLTETPLCTQPTGNPCIDLDVGSITVPIGYVRKMVEASQGLHDDLLRRAKTWPGDEACKVVCAGAGAWSRFCEALELGQSVITAFDQEAERG